MKIGDYEVAFLSKDSLKVGCQEVTREELNQLIEGLDNYVKIEVGDYVRVKITRPQHQEPEATDAIDGAYGIARFINPRGTEVAVEFARRYPIPGATGYGMKLVAPGHGLWVYLENLELVDKGIR